jgi:hypothetical protein
MAPAIDYLHPDDSARCENADPAQKLDEFRQYYNTHRVHTALDGITASELSGETITHRAALNNLHWKSHCRGLYHLPATA